MASIYYDPQGQAWEIGFGPSGTYIDGQGWGTRRKDLDVPKAPPPPVAPDLTDDLVQQARKNQVRRQLMGQGIASTFLTGPLGPGSPAPTSSPGLFGA